MTLTAVVLNFNGLKDTIECIRSLKKCHSGPYKLNIVVVDNGSDDKNVASLSQVNDITLIRNNRNLGYSGGNNVGIKYALGKNSDLIILLNNDIIVDQNLLQYLAKLTGKILAVFTLELMKLTGVSFQKASKLILPPVPACL